MTEYGTIYGLVDPRTDEVKYVGKTTKPITARLADHLAAPAPAVRVWIEELAIDGRRPEIVPLREDVPAPQLDAAEREEIATRAERGDLLNIVGNKQGNARRRKASRQEAQRRKSEEEAVRQAWQQASWRQVADQIRAATGGPMPPSDIPARPVPAPVWDLYLAFHEADQVARQHEALLYPFLTRPGVKTEKTTSSTLGIEDAYAQRRCTDPALERYMRAYCATFSWVDEGDRWGTKQGVFGRGDSAYKQDFRDSPHLARYLSLIAWAGRALDPWVALADKAGIGPGSGGFTEWVSDDNATREAIRLFQKTAPGWLGIRYQEWDTTVADFMLALGTAHIPGFAVPDLLKGNLQKRLNEVAGDRQATRAMCRLLQSINPRALDAVYGRDELAESDTTLGLPPGTSAEVVRHVYGSGRGDPNDRTAKLLQRHTGQFDAIDMPDYLNWTGIHVPAMRVAAASFCLAGLFPDAAGASREELLRTVTRTWMPDERALRDLDELEEEMRLRDTEPS
ncbi:hypothetical protein GKJPGBOP_08238 [Streptomyces paromomycinus]|uniref:Uncharacterized protein n=1 Tax=Streptomyces paromomycinus TaxID=92743 RepID=A0A401WGN1_STREY|nr:hypothetical protein GKJPGBOP_00030 [Streptomyces paromomycinus]GCD48440.1 hypothetical protein GKJPGBOP_08238 [Streptomyces paromomycinus]